MKTLDFVLYKNEIYRLLDTKENKSLIINCIKITMPIWVETTMLKACLSNDIERFKTVDENCLSSIKKKQAHERYTLIAPVLPFVSDEHIRSLIISKIAEKKGFTKQTIRKYLCLYLVYQNISGLVSLENNEKVLTEDEKNFRWALNKFYYKPFGHSLKDTYLLLLKEKYTNNGVLVENHPPFHRFRYFYQKTKKLQNYYISRNGLSNYQRNNRPLLGESVRDFATSIGMGMIDSTVLDIYIVNDAGQLVGRPIFTACIDAYSGLCCGYTLSWEGGVNSLKELLHNIVSDKVEHCKRFGIDINNEDWNCNQLPATLVTDKGKEYTSYILEQITDLGVSIVNLPPYRPDLKSCVEKFFDIIQNLYKPHLRGKGVIENDFQERGAIDYRKTATLTLKELETIILKCIIYYNTRRIVENFDYSNNMIESSVSPYSNSIWNYAINSVGSNLISVTLEQLYLTLLPRTTGSFSRKGLICNKLRYHAEGYLERYLKGDKCIVSYDLNNTSCVWLFEDGEYIKFALIEKEFEDLTVENAHNIMTKRESFLHSFQDENLQARIDLIDDIQVIAKNGLARKSADTSSIRQTRKREKIKKRLDV